MSRPRTPGLTFEQATPLGAPTPEPLPDEAELPAAPEYTQDTADVWQIAHLCNRMAGHGWRPIAVVPGLPGIEVDMPVGLGKIEPRPAAMPYVVLFERRVPG